MDREGHLKGTEGKLSDKKTVSVSNVIVFSMETVCRTERVDHGQSRIELHGMGSKQ